MYNSNVAIRQAGPRDFEAVCALLRNTGLPTEGVAEHFQHFFMAELDEDLAGCVGLEVYGRACLLRSLAVARTFRQRGLGSLLTKRSLQEAASLGCQEAILLTTTGEGFFRRLGFEKIARAETSAEVRQSVEWRLNCCETAVCMRLRLKQ